MYCITLLVTFCLFSLVFAEEGNLYNCVKRTKEIDGPIQLTEEELKCLRKEVGYEKTPNNFIPPTSPPQKLHEDIYNFVKDTTCEELMHLIVLFTTVEDLERVPKEKPEQTIAKRKAFYDYWTNIIEEKYNGRVAIRWGIIFGMSIDIPANNLLQLAAQDGVDSFNADDQWLTTKEKCQK